MLNDLGNSVMMNNFYFFPTSILNQVDRYISKIKVEICKMYHHPIQRLRNGIQMDARRLDTVLESFQGRLFQSSHQMYEYT